MKNDWPRYVTRSDVEGENTDRTYLEREDEVQVDLDALFDKEVLGGGEPVVDASVLVAKQLAKEAERLRRYAAKKIEAEERAQAVLKEVLEEEEEVNVNVKNVEK